PGVRQTAGEGMAGRAEEVAEAVRQQHAADGREQCPPHLSRRARAGRRGHRGSRRGGRREGGGVAGGRLHTAAALPGWEAPPLACQQDVTSIRLGVWRSVPCEPSAFVVPLGWRPGPWCPCVAPPGRAHFAAASRRAHFSADGLGGSAQPTLASARSVIGRRGTGTCGVATRRAWRNASTAEATTHPR